MKKIRSIEAKAGDIPADFLKKLGSHISQVGGLYVHTPTQLKKKSKTYLIKQVLRLEKLILIITYNAYKMQLPRLKVIKRKAKTVKIPIMTELGQSFMYAPSGTSELAAQKFYDAGIRGGLETQKPLRFYESKRKTKRKFSAKQLKAQRLFAKRAKAGTLRRRR